MADGGHRAWVPAACERGGVRPSLSTPEGPSPATPALGTTSNATKDSGTLVWVEGGQGASRAPGCPQKCPLSFPQSWWVGVRGQARCVCVTAAIAVRHFFLSDENCGPLRTLAKVIVEGPFRLSLSHWRLLPPRLRQPFPCPPRPFMSMGSLIHKTGVSFSAAGSPDIWNQPTGTRASSDFSPKLPFGEKVLD